MPRGGRSAISAGKSGNLARIARFAADGNWAAPMFGCLLRWARSTGNVFCGAEMRIS